MMSLCVQCVALHITFSSSPTWCGLSTNCPYKAHCLVLQILWYVSLHPLSKHVLFMCYNYAWMRIHQTITLWPLLGYPMKNTNCFGRGANTLGKGGIINDSCVLLTVKPLLLAFEFKVTLCFLFIDFSSCISSVKVVLLAISMPWALLSMQGVNSLWVNYWLDLCAD